MKLRRILGNIICDIRDTKRYFLCRFFGWKKASSDYPFLGQICKVYGCKKAVKYIDPGIYPDFCENEKEKREWFQFVDAEDEVNGFIINVGWALWKPYKCIE